MLTNDEIDRLENAANDMNPQALLDALAALRPETLGYGVRRAIFASALTVAHGPFPRLHRSQESADRYVAEKEREARAKIAQHIDFARFETRARARVA